MPSPHISALKDDALMGTLPLLGDFLPAVMQALHYYTDMMMYEQLHTTTIEPPLGINNVQADNSPTTTWKPYMTQKPTPTRKTTQRPTTTRRPVTTTTRRTTTRRTTTPTTTTTTTPKPTTTTTTRRTTTRRTTKPPRWITPKPHKPGYYSPDRPPYWMFFGMQKPNENNKPGGVQRPQQNVPDKIKEPTWQDPAFVQWFFQGKPKELEPFDDDVLQLLDPLPKKLLLDLHYETNQLPALLDQDNVIEFRKKYDDSYNSRYRNQSPSDQQMRVIMKIQMQQQRPMLVGRKKPPPTRPYVFFLMLYDLLKRESKTKMLHKYGGFTPELLRQLAESSQHSADWQLNYLIQTMLDRKEVTAADVLSRAELVLTDLNNPASITSQALRYIPPLVFLP
ncbi:unnamed protein product [Diamesa serratosioi]